MPQVTIGNTTVDYTEIRPASGGPGPRGIKVWIKGVQGSNYTYQPITPNPHNNPAYNKKKGWPVFYNDAADALAQYYNTNGNFPSAGVITFSFGGVIYTIG